MGNIASSKFQKRNNGLDTIPNKRPLRKRARKQIAIFEIFILE
jgi:hypothetical protein